MIKITIHPLNFFKIKIFSPIVHFQTRIFPTGRKFFDNFSTVKNLGRAFAPSPILQFFPLPLRYCAQALIALHAMEARTERRN